LFSGPYQPVSPSQLCHTNLVLPVACLPAFISSSYPYLVFLPLPCLPAHTSLLLTLISSYLLDLVLFFQLLSLLFVPLACISSPALIFLTFLVSIIFQFGTEPPFYVPAQSCLPVRVFVIFQPVFCLLAHVLSSCLPTSRLLACISSFCVFQLLSSPFVPLACILSPALIFLAFLVSIIFQFGTGPPIYVPAQSCLPDCIFVIFRPIFCPPARVLSPCLRLVSLPPRLDSLPASCLSARPHLVFLPESCLPTGISYFCVHLFFYQQSVTPDPNAAKAHSRQSPCCHADHPPG
jgi:hypothetical protein